MSSRDADLPKAIPAMWRALVRGYQAEPLLLPVAFGFSLLSALPDALMALWLKLLADGVLAHNRALAIGAAVGLAAFRRRYLVPARHQRSHATPLSRTIDRRS